MSEDLLINVTPRETRVALVENGMLQEMHVERASRRGYVGHIYGARVLKVMPGMQAAFVDIGLERAAFLHASDIYSAAEAELAAPPPEPPIHELVVEGQLLTVQVIKDPIGSKGARVSTHFSLPSRFLVLLPHSRVIGVSQRIEDEAERARLRETLRELSSSNGESYGYIVRTNAEGASSEALAADLDYLRKLWASIADRLAAPSVGARVYEEPTLALKVLRDLMTASIEKVRIDSRETWRSAVEFAARFTPAWVERIEHYRGECPIFDLYGIDDEIDRALDRHVPLKSGGGLVIDQTEAMTTIDVNTGGFLGHRNLEETIYRTNLEAAQALARQLRLRNLGGIIIIDFIDMEDPEHRRQVLRTLEKSLARDHAKTQVFEMTSLGLVQMTRKRTTDSLARQLSEPCPACKGLGLVKSPETVSYEIFREITRAVRQFDARRLLVMAPPRVVHRIVEEDSQAVAELEEFIGKTIEFKADDSYGPEQFDVVVL